MEPTTCIEAEPFALMVKDDSMEPEFREGCVIIIDPTGRLTDGAFVLAEVEGRYLFRKLSIRAGAVHLAPLNPRYPPTRVENLSVVRGVIVQRAGRRRAEHRRYG